MSTRHWRTLKGSLCLPHPLNWFCWVTTITVIMIHHLFTKYQLYPMNNPLCPTSSGNPTPPPSPNPRQTTSVRYKLKFKYSANNYIRTLLLRLPFPLGFSLLVSFGFFSFLTGGLPLPAVFLSRAPFSLPLAGAPPKKARMSWTEKLHYLVTCRKPTTVRVTNIKVSELTDMDIVKKNWFTRQCLASCRQINNSASRHLWTRVFSDRDH